VSRVSGVSRDDIAAQVQSFYCLLEVETGKSTMFRPNGSEDIFARMYIHVDDVNFGPLLLLFVMFHSKDVQGVKKCRRRQFDKVWCQIFLGAPSQNGKNIPKWPNKYTKMAKETYQIGHKIPNGHEIHQYFPFFGRPKCTKILGIFWYEKIPSGNPVE
jgi:hypothetical protein